MTRSLKNKLRRHLTQLLSSDDYTNRRWGIKSLEYLVLKKEHGMEGMYWRWDKEERCWYTNTIYCRTDKMRNPGLRGVSIFRKR